jgi:hypothetical protein
MANLTCPHCTTNLAGKLLRGKALPGERRLFPNRATLICPVCEPRLYGNPYPAEIWAILAFLPMLLMMYGFQWIGVSAKPYKLLFIGALLFAMIVNLCIYLKYLRHWPSFRATPLKQFPFKRRK